MASRAEKLKRRQHRKAKKDRRANTDISKLAPPRDLVLVDPPGALKMSEVLPELVEPWWHDCADEKAMRRLLTLGTAAWNAALLNGASRAAHLEDLAKTFPIEIREDFQKAIQPLIRRKEELFPNLKRPILSFELTWLPSGDPYLVVMSGLK